MPRPHPWLLRQPDPSSAGYLFCIPYSGTGASMYARWPRRIGPAEVCPVQPPGRENRIAEAHYGTFEALAEALAEDLMPLLDRPFAFFGHCSSALAGFATARHLQRLGAPTPARLFVSSQVAPHDGPYGRYLEMDRQQLTQEVVRLVNAMGGGTPPPAFLEMGVDLMCADVDANRSYVVSRPEPVPYAITLLGWSEDFDVPPALMKGWHAYGDRVRQVTLRGHHHSFLGAPLALIGEIAADLREDLHVHHG